jgi:hypothetical protein
MMRRLMGARDFTTARSVADPDIDDVTALTNAALRPRRPRSSSGGAARTRSPPGEGGMDLYHLAGGIGVILTLAGLWRAVANLRFLARTTAVEGKFVHWEITAAGKVGGPSSEDGRRSYRPIVAFRAADGSG